jgi:hypothetical protein
MATRILGRIVDQLFRARKLAVKVQVKRPSSRAIHQDRCLLRKLAMRSDKWTYGRLTVLVTWSLATREKHGLAVYQNLSPITDPRQARTLSRGFDIGRRVRSFPPLPSRLVLPHVRQAGRNQQRRTVPALAKQCSRPLDPPPLSSVIGLLGVGKGGVSGLDSASFEDDWPARPSACGHPLLSSRSGRGSLSAADSLIPDFDFVAVRVVDIGEWVAGAEFAPA